MTPPDLVPAATTTIARLDRPDTPRGAVGSLEELLSTVPCTAEAAAADLASVAARSVAAPVTVLVEHDQSWLVVAGPAPLAPSPPGDHLQRRASLRAGAVRGGSTALLWDPTITVEPSLATTLVHACVWLTLSRERDEAGDGERRAVDETQVMRDVVGRLLSVRDVDQVLLSIADHTLRLLDADICGVLLREGDEVRMRSCVGHRVVDTARLRMRRGQGVAGLVFLTGEPARVDNYLHDRTISQDFMFLAEQEDTESALAVPLRLQGEFVGVLEVWRRRPSVFTDQDVARMVSLADFATIAIDNARLHDEQNRAVARMEEAHSALERQVRVLDRSSRLQQALLATVLEGGGLPAIARAVTTNLDCRIGIYGPDGAIVAPHRAPSLAKVPTRMPTSVRPGRATVQLPHGEDVPAWVQPVHADGDQAGCICLLGGVQSAEMMDVVAGQVAMACSLALLRQHAANQARNEVLEQLVWDLLQGSPEHRVAARSHAQRLNVPLGGALRVLYGRLENIDDLAGESGWDTSQTDRVRRDVLRAVRTVDERPGLALTSLRGDVIVGVATALDAPSTKDLIRRVIAAVREDQPGLRLSWGVSRSHDDTAQLPSGLNEAKTAVSAALRLGGESVMLYEELGIVRLLLGSGDDPDLQTFVDDVTGPLLAYDRESDGALVRTLRAFFDADCSQRVAAERLFVHHKTLRYRLERIKALTGLDLNRHEDRMRADVALRLLQINRSGDEECTGADKS
jgi:sugar diacid utilization regulator/putative methionine-R-sulfoxide reductase with GAF domain